LDLTNGPDCLAAEATRIIFHADAYANLMGLEKGAFSEKRGPRWLRLIPAFGEISKFDELVKSRQKDGFVKSSRCKARKN
jgi:uncharacterized protein (UPF0254 family)